MTENLETQPSNELERQNQETEAQKRIKQLSEKVRLTSEERDEKDNLLKERDTKIAELERENVFNSGFVDVLTTHLAAKDHKDEIKAKVLSGYTVEDATFAVLGKAGKLGQPQASHEPANPAGGSASTTLPQGGTKKFEDMSREEKREALMQAEREGGIALT